MQELQPTEGVILAGQTNVLADHDSSTPQRYCRAIRLTNWPADVLMKLRFLNQHALSFQQRRRVW